MSDFQAIGGVSASLKALLRSRMEVPAAIPGGTFQITVSPPPVPPEEGGGVEAPQVNLFLYRVTRNGALANQEIPGNGHPAAYGRPPLSLDLHFLLTAYGTSEQEGELDETVSHFLLGSAMRVFHDVSVITEDLVDGGGVPVLHPSLHGEYERVKISLDPISLEDLAKVWTATTFPYRLSAAYTVSVVQIESRAPRRHPQPVAEPIPADPAAAGPQVLVLPVVRPRIDEVRVRRGGTESRHPFARVLDELVLLGAGLAGGTTRVWIGGVEATAGIASQRQDRLVVAVPDHPDLRPGPQTVSVTVGGSAFRSNLAVFMLVPHVTGVARAFAPAPRRFVVSGTRLWADDLTGEVLIGDEPVPKEAYVAAADAQVTVPLPDNLPARPVRCLRSNALGAVAVPDPDLTVAVDGGAPAALTLTPAPGDLAGAAAALERALRQAAGGAALAGVRVAAGASRLWVIPGELDHGLAFAGPAAGSLELTAAAGASEVEASLSGRLSPFPDLTSASPELRVTIDGTTRDATLAGRPADLAEAAVLLRDALQAAAPPASFGQAEVVVLGEQLLVVPGAGAAGGAVFAPVPGADETTVRELRLALDHRVRVRVHGAESVETVLEALP